MRSPDYKKFIFFITIATLLYVFLLSGLLFFEKNTTGGTIHRFDEAIWYSIVTLTTVGYGDYTPVSMGGRFIGIVFVILSLSVYGILIGQITNFMATVKQNKKLGYLGTDFENHTVIIGWNSFGKAVVDQLVGVGKKVAVITNNSNDLELIRENYNKKLVYILFSDLKNFDLIKKSNIHLASNVFINLPDDTEKLVYILNLRKVFGDLKIVVTLDNSDLKNTFHSAGTTYTISKNEISSKLLASYIFEPDVAEYSEDIMSYAEDEDDHDIKEFKVLKSNPYCGREYDYAFLNLKKNCNSILIGISKDEGNKRVLIKNPADQLVINENDYLIMITSNRSQKLLNKIFQTEEGFLGA